jgi:hypothetical protein
LDTLFKDREERSVDSGQIKKMIVVFLLVSCALSPVSSACAEVLERVVAIVNDDLILLSEFQEALKSARETDSSVTREGVLNEMIDNLLLLEEAKKFRTGTASRGRRNDREDRVIIHEYIDRRIKALIHIPYEDIEHYYQMNRDLYGGKEINEVRDAIEEQLVASELKSKVREHIEELRKKAYIRIQLDGDD